MLSPGPLVKESAALNLAQLIESRMRDENGNDVYSLGYLARRAQAAGYPKFSKAILSRIRSIGIEEFPRIETVWGLAAALDCSADMVVDACKVSLGLVTSQHPTSRVIIVAPESYTPEEIDEARAAVTFALREYRRLHGVDTRE